MAAAGEIPPPVAAPPPPASSIIDILGEEIVGIIAPVSLCMLIVVLLVAALSTPASSSLLSDAGRSTEENLAGAAIAALIFVAAVTAATFLLFFLFYLRLTAFLRYYTAFSSFLVLLFLGGQLSAILISRFNLSLDVATFSLLLFNFSAVGAISVLAEKGGVPILLNQGFLVAIGILVAFWFTRLRDWTTWALLIAMAVYDLAAVLLPVGPLRLLVELAIARDEEIPALVYEARPVLNPREFPPNRRNSVIRDEMSGRIPNPETRIAISGDEEVFNSREISPLPPRNRRNPHIGGEISGRDPNSETRIALSEEESEICEARLVPISPPPLPNRRNPQIGDAISDQNPNSETRIALSEEESEIASLRTPLIAPDEPEGIGLSSTCAIKLGLGDFIFYSVLVGRAAMHDFTAVYACYLAIVAGLGVTLLLLGVYRRALPALPVSIALGVVFYLLSRFLLEEFLVLCSVNLVIF